MFPGVLSEIAESRAAERITYKFGLDTAGKKASRIRCDPFQGRAVVSSHHFQPFFARPCGLGRVCPSSGSRDDPLLTVRTG